VRLGSACADPARLVAHMEAFMTVLTGVLVVAGVFLATLVGPIREFLTRGLRSAATRATTDLLLDSAKQKSDAKRSVSRHSPAA